MRPKHETKRSVKKLKREVQKKVGLREDEQTSIHVEGLCEELEESNRKGNVPFFPIIGIQFFTVFGLLISFRNPFFVGNPLPVVDLMHTSCGLNLLISVLAI